MSKSTTYPKLLLIKTPPHQCAAPGTDPMNNPHLRINYTDPTEDSYPGRITVHVLPSSRTRFSNLSCHCTGTASVVFPQTNATATRTHTMGQRYPLIRPGPGTNPPIYPLFLVPTRRGLPEVRIPKGLFFFHLFWWSRSKYIHREREKKKEEKKTCLLGKMFENRFLHTSGREEG